MPLADGGSLGDAVPSGGLGGKDLLDLLHPIATGVAFLHQNDVLHRDLSPSNVLKVNDVWVISDFGLSVSALLPTSYQTSTGVSGYGSPAFVSPEQRRDLSSATVRSDIYGLGKLVQFMSEGSWPDFQPKATGEFAGVVGRATRLDPRERYGTVEDLHAAVSVVATAPPPSTSIADRVDSLLEFSRLTHTGRGPEYVELLSSLDPDDDYEEGEIKRLLPAISRHRWLASWREDPDRTVLAIETACRAAFNEAEFDKLDGLLFGLIEADQAIENAEIRHSVVATLAHLGSSNDQWSYRRPLINLLKERTSTSRVPATVSGLRQAGASAVRWILHETRIETFPQPLRGWLNELVGATR